MDKETLSKYGWVVIVIIVLVILMSFAAPFGQYFSDSTMAILNSLSKSAGINVQLNPDGTVIKTDSQGNPIADYTTLEIEADEHIYAIGLVKQEDVVAIFNEDYSEVTIMKNNADSNGTMMNYITDDGSKNIGLEEALTLITLSPMSQHADTLKTVNIKEGVLSIGSAAFYNCNNLKTINLPSSAALIFSLSFYGCSGLENISIPSTYKYLTGKSSGPVHVYNATEYYNGIIMAPYAFAECNSLKKVSLGNGMYTMMAGTFSNCNSLKSIVCSEDTSFSDNNGLDKDTVFNGTNSVVIYGYGTNANQTTPKWFADYHKQAGVSYFNISAEPQLTLEYIASTKQSQIESTFNAMKNDMIKPIADAFNLSYTSALHFALLSESGETEDDALAIVNQGEEYSRAYINNNCIDILSGGNANVKTLDDWFYINTSVHEKDAINYMETGSWDATVFAQIYADEIKSDIVDLVTEYNISYYSAVLIWIDKDVTYKEFTLAQQSESELESYVNSYYKELFKSESGNNSIDTADEYFKHKLGKTAHDIA